MVFRSINQLWTEFMKKRHTLWCHQTWLDGKSSNWMEVLWKENHRTQLCIFQHPMFDYRMVIPATMGDWEKISGWWLYTYSSEKYVFVNWDDDYSQLNGKIQFTFQTTNQKWSGSQNHVFRSRKRWSRVLFTLGEYMTSEGGMSMLIYLHVSSCPFTHMHINHHKPSETIINQHSHAVIAVHDMVMINMLSGMMLIEILRCIVSGSKHCGDGAASCWCWVQCSPQPSAGHCWCQQMGC